MKILTLNCNACGAPLEVSAKAKYVTCRYCDAQLVVKQADSAAWTEAVEEIRDEVRALRRRAELEDLDREWEREREKYLVQGKHGTSEPSKVGSAAGGIFAAVFGVFWTIFAGAIFPPMAIFGVIFIVVAIFQGVSGTQKATALEAARRRYEERRRKLLAEIADGKRA